MQTPVDLLRSWQQGVPEILARITLNSVIAELGKTVPGFREDHATIVPVIFVIVIGLTERDSFI